MKAQFLTALTTTDIDEKWACVREPFRVLFDPALETVAGGYIAILTVPVGFLTDFASVPRLPVVYTIAGGRGRRAAVVHDFLYKYGLVPRAVADQAFYLCLLASEVNTWIALMMKTAVRRWGWIYYRPQNGAVLSMEATT